MFLMVYYGYRLFFLINKCCHRWIQHMKLWDNLIKRLNFLRLYAIVEFKIKHIKLSFAFIHLLYRLVKMRWQRVRWEYLIFTLSNFFIYLFHSIFKTLLQLFKMVYIIIQYLQWHLWHFIKFNFYHLLYVLSELNIPLFPLFLNKHYLFL